MTVSEVAQSRSTDRVQQELQTIADRYDGKLPASAVVDFARDPSTALHARFDWDDSVAAEKWRLEQARTIIARVKITFDHRPNVQVRAWVSLPQDRVTDEPSYRATVNVMSDSDLRQQLLSSVKDELVRLRRKHADLSELASVWVAIDGALASGEAP